MITRRLTLIILTSVCALAGTLVYSASAPALTEHVLKGMFGGEGTEPGKFEDPIGIAVNDTTHNVYVADDGNKRVEEFTSAGTYIREFTPPGGFAEPQQIAVDNSGDPLDPSAGDVYVTDRYRSVVYKFSETGEYIGQVTGGGSGSWSVVSGVAVSTDGTLWVVANESGSGKVSAESFSDARVNAFLENGNIASSAFEGGGRGEGLAVDSEENLYAGYNVTVHKYTNFNFSGEFGSDTSSALETGIAFDTSGDELYISHNGEVEAYGPNGLLTESLDSGGGGSVAVDSSSGSVSSHAVYAFTASDQVAIFDQILLPDVTTGLAPSGEEHEGSVTLDGTVDPDGEPVTSCQFEYGTEASHYESTAPCVPSPGDGTTPVEVHAEVSGLTPLTRYHYRLVAGNANGTNPGYDQTFVAATAPIVESEYVTGVASGSATLQAQVNPGGAETTYRFEYGLTSSYGTILPTSEGHAGSGAADTSIGVTTQDLQPGTTYHFRVVLSNALGRDVAGPDEEFTTQPAPSEFLLPDGRQWELVSPPSKYGAGLLSIGYEQGAVIQAAQQGGAITYAATAPIVADPPGNRALETIQVLSRRGPGGWETQDISTPTTESGHLYISEFSEYKLFSEDLSLGLVEPRGETALPPLPEGSERTPYLRKDLSGEYEPLLTTANTLAGADYGKQEAVHYEGGSPSLHQIILHSNNVPLLAGAVENTLYEWSEGQLQPVSVLPADEGGAVVEGTLGNQHPVDNGGKMDQHAVSSNGSLVVWTGPGEGAGFGLYLRDMTRKETLKLDVPQTGAQGGNGERALPEFEGANAEDTRIFFKDNYRLTKGSSELGRDLYVFEVTSHGDEPLSGKLTDLTGATSTGESAHVQGVVGSSEDGATIYFVAAGILGDGAEHGAEPGEYNLYVEHYSGTEWTAPRFIATLSEEDEHDFWEPDLGRRTARVSPNGRYLAFMSERSLTGYDNRDANSGQADEEVFLYDADSGRLACASCDPTGARPRGMLVTHEFPGALVDYARNWPGRWLAANVPGWTTDNLSDAQYQSRYLSNNGRLFFDSVDPLVPADVNGQENVYEYEPEGVGSCSSTSSGSSIVFSVSAGGCVGLISSGTSPEESAFLDASEEGGEVFFLTSSRLARQDYDNSYDVYVAHECTSASPCPPQPPAVPPACTTAEACRAAPTPQPAIFGSPSSATFSGAGNVAPSTSSATVTPKSSVSAQKLADALKTCRKRSKRKRARCEAQARKRYGTGSRAKKKPSKKPGR